MNKKNPIKIGEIFGKFIVISKSSFTDKRHNSYYECKCICGNNTVVIGSRLRLGKSSSCRECRYARVRKYPGFASWSHKYSQYRHSATKRKIEFNLNIDEFIALSSLACSYCGDGLRIYNVYAKDKRALSNLVKRSNILISGIDRVNSDKGYNLFNCVPCCADCNQMKSDKTLEQFLNHINKIINFYSPKIKKTS